jgi:hypothetical protein
MVVNKLWTKNRNFAIIAAGQKISGIKIGIFRVAM